MIGPMISALGILVYLVGFIHFLAASVSHDSSLYRDSFFIAWLQSIFWPLYLVLAVLGKICSVIRQGAIDLFLLVECDDEEV